MMQIYNTLKYNIIQYTRGSSYELYLNPKLQFIFNHFKLIE